MEITTLDQAKEYLAQNYVFTNTSHNSQIQTLPPEEVKKMLIKHCVLNFAANQSWFEREAETIVTTGSYSSYWDCSMNILINSIKLAEVLGMQLDPIENIEPEKAQGFKKCTPCISAMARNCFRLDAEEASAIFQLKRILVVFWQLLIGVIKNENYPNSISQLLQMIPSHLKHYRYQI